jgi:hypothetical protein
MVEALSQQVLGSELKPQYCQRKKPNKQTRDSQERKFCRGKSDERKGAGWKKGKGTKNGKHIRSNQCHS